MTLTPSSKWFRKLKKIKGPCAAKTSDQCQCYHVYTQSRTRHSSGADRYSLAAVQGQNCKYLKREIKRLPGIHVKWQHPEMSMIEGVLARGDRRIGASHRAGVEKTGLRFRWMERPVPVRCLDERVSVNADWIPEWDTAAGANGNRMNPCPGNIWTPRIDPDVL